MGNPFDITGKVVLVTGAYGHLGRSMCLALAENGASLVLAGRQAGLLEELKEKLSQATGNERLFPVTMDVGSERSVEEAVKQVMDRWGVIDVLINNAYFGAGGDLLSMTLDDWNRGLAGSVTGVFLCCRAVLPHMIRQGGGSVINISSMYGVVAPDVSIYEDNKFYNPPNYGAGKAAIIQLTRYIACVYGKDGVRSNSISPGPFPSKDVQEDTLFVERLAKKVPLGRIGAPGELQGVVMLLASGVSSYINGANIPVDGGWTAW